MPHLPSWVWSVVTCVLVGYAGYLRLWRGEKMGRSLADAVFGGCLTALVLVLATPDLPRVWPTLSSGIKAQAILVLLATLVLCVWFWQDALFYSHQKRKDRITNPPA